MFDFYYQLRQKMIDSMQNSLRQVRQVLGLGVQELSDIVGLTRQTLNNLECKKSRMSAAQYLAICAVIDYYTRDKPEQYAAIQTILSSCGAEERGTFFPSINNNSLLKNWFLCFPDDSKITEAFSGNRKVITLKEFEGIAYSHKIFVDDTILGQEGFDDWLRQVSDIMLDKGNRFLIPLKVIENIQGGILSPDPLTAGFSQRGMKVLTGMQQSGLMEIRGEKSDTNVMGTFISVFARFKHTNRLALLTQNEKLARQILALNNDDLGGFPIYVAQFAQGIGLREWDAAESELPMGEALNGWETIEL